MARTTSLFLLSLLAACANSLTILETAKATPELSSLVAALETAGLDSTFDSDASTFTVFAPTNTAFDNLATALGVTIDELLALPTLSYILQYHVLASEVTAAEVTDGMDAATILAEYQELSFSVADGVVMVNDATVTAADVACDGGVVHIIDTVLLAGDMAMYVTMESEYSTLLAALTAASLVDAVTGAAPAYTLFAPTNAAFDALLTTLGMTAEELLADVDSLTKILTFHLVEGVVVSGDIMDGTSATTLEGNKLTFSTADGVTIRGGVLSTIPTVTGVDDPVLNGVIHSIDAVLIPPNVLTDKIPSDTSDEPDFNAAPTTSSLVFASLFAAAALFAY